jgi:hypothetical protein
MKFEMFSEVKLLADVPEHGLRRGDLATIVDFHRGVPGQESGYSLEVFNAVGDTVAVIALGESQIETLREDEILCARVLAA